MTPDPYILFLFGLGAVVLLVSWAPVGLKRLPLTLAILCVAVGILVFSTGLLSFNPDPRTWDTATERLTELVVIISLMGAGLKLDRPVGWRNWSTTVRLLVIAMPLTIVAVALLGWAGLGFSLAMALLFGASMAPTDPVLAADVQVGPPKSGDEDEVRFGLTSEAGLNDALAFPFVHLAILAAAGGLATQSGLTDWFTIKVGWKLLAGLGAGLLIGKGLGYLLFRSRRGLSKLADGLIALAATLMAYSVTEMVHGYGFLAVFVCAVMIRGSERDHDFHQEMHDFSDQIERLLMMLLLVLFGGALANGLLDSLTWTDALIGLAVVFVVRPVAGLMAMIGSGQPWRERLLLAFLGIRGVGSVYYLAYGINHGDFGNSERLWAVVGFIILLSIIVHGVTATPLLARLARRREAEAD
ncbi:MAG: cation:proton antiporter [Alphaproteobacteria bacterium]|nr:cation:proton antiporter [Alphaproteobacteria bacterium]MBU2043207.1 cation:proton antiporter [Alphaproteobacteria bacterium]MBU2124763.1 cation:proton antiporter [Alphaproteobacteria bacterium]MBU2209819.1 cation:proton antiporter [Alphaproteobacteria bacterium]MBU2292256.1 cation:proton antiporter [Alphaproteobacteria bacterium]